MLDLLTLILAAGGRLHAGGGAGVVAGGGQAKPARQLPRGRREKVRNPRLGSGDYPSSARPVIPLLCYWTIESINSGPEGWPFHVTVRFSCLVYVTNISKFIMRLNSLRTRVTEMLFSNECTLWWQCSYEVSRNNQEPHSEMNCAIFSPQEYAETTGTVLYQRITEGLVQ